MTIYNATTQRCHVIDARDVAPAIANSTMFTGRLNMTERGMGNGFLIPSPPSEVPFDETIRFESDTWSRAMCDLHS